MQLLKIVSGPLVGALLWWLIAYFGADPMVARMAGVAGWMAAWWISEAIPLAVTSLLPVFLFPIMDIMSTKEVAPYYMNEVLMLFVGGFIMAFAMEKWDLHRRIALRIILWVGTEMDRILLGMMLATFLLSMWISNTATTMMMIPTVLAVIYKIRDVSGAQQNHIDKGLLLGVAYAASIGGTATLVGTPPNLIFLAHYTEQFPGRETISFMSWFMVGFPLALLMLGAAYWYLRRVFHTKDIKLQGGQVTVFRDEYKSLGKISYEERVVMVLFTMMALLWFFRSNIDFGIIYIPGWVNLFDNPQYFQDGTVAVLIATLLFLIPSKNKKGEMLMDWKNVQRLPLNVILLFGGGFALAAGVSKSGLDLWMAGGMEGLSTLPIWLMVITVCLFMTFLTEITSNMATTQLVMPIFGAIALGSGIDPLYLMIPATFSASFAFMLPVATAPNTIVFGSEMLTVKDMAKTGFALNLLGVVITSVVMLTLGRWVFGLG